MSLGVGIDTVDVQRFADMVERRPEMLERLFTSGERAYGESLANPHPSMAVRFAAKEATMKAMGVGLGAFGFHDVEVTKAVSGAPALALYGAALELSDQLGVKHWRISLTHTCSVATAMVIAE